MILAYVPQNLAHELHLVLQLVMSMGKSMWNNHWGFRKMGGPEMDDWGYYDFGNHHLISHVDLVVGI